MDLPSLGCHNGKCQSYGIHLRYSSEGLIIVNTMHLLKSFGTNLGFVSANMSIRCALGPVDPSTSDKFPPRRKGNHILSLVLEEGVVILLRGWFPKGISSSLAIIIWIWRLNQENMYGWKWSSSNECNRRLLKIISAPPSIASITNEIPCILKSSLCPVGPLLSLCNCIWILWLCIWLYWIWIIWFLWIRTLFCTRVGMCMLIISDRWKNEGLSMQLLRYMRDAFL